MGAGSFGRSHGHRHCTLIAISILTCGRIIIEHATASVCVGKAERVRAQKGQGLSIAEIANAMAVSKLKSFQ